MADEFARLQIRIDANDARFQKGIKGASAGFNKRATEIERRAKQMEGRVGKSFGNVSRRGRAAFGNVSQQLQDVIVQAQMGTDAFRILGQQGPQIAGAFGPAGAAIGVVVAAIAVAIPSILKLTSASDDLKESMGKLQEQQEALEAIQKNLSLSASEIAKKYREAAAEITKIDKNLARLARADALEELEKLAGKTVDVFEGLSTPIATAGDQLKRFENIIRKRADQLGITADQMKELNAEFIAFGEGKSFDEQLPALLRILDLIEKLKVDLSFLPKETRALIREMLEVRKRAVTVAVAVEDIEGAVATAKSETEGLADAMRIVETRALNAAKAIRDVVAGEIRLGARTEEGKTAKPRKAGGGLRSERAQRRSGGGRKRKDTSAVRIVERSQDALASLQGEARLIGLTARARAVEAAAIARATAQEKLLNAAKAEGATITPKQIEQGKELLALIEAQTLANFDVQAAIDRSTKSAEDAAERQKELAESISEVSDRMLGAIQNAESFEDALKRVGIELLRLLGSGVVGEGPLGSAFNKLLGTSANGVIGALLGGSGASFDVAGAGLDSSSIFSGAFTFSNAKGNAFRGGNVIPFASGGVVNGPATFPMPNGIGLMGEAGPEAIMPLSRGPGGKLGVAASGGGGTTVVIHSTFQGVNEATQEQLRGMLAQQKVEIMQEVPQVAAAGMAQRPALRGR